MSFISPEDVLADKHIYKVQHFLRHLVSKNNINLPEEYIENLEDKYKDYIYNLDEQLEREFYKKNDFRTTVRGIKVRGVYDTEKEAQIRAKQLQRKDKNFNVYVGQVGFWLPWNPAPHTIEQQEYFENELNELVQKYKENQADKEDHFRENVEYVKEQAEKKVKEQKAEQQKLADQENQEKMEARAAEIDELGLERKTAKLKNKEELATDAEEQPSIATAEQPSAATEEQPSSTDGQTTGGQGQGQEQPSEGQEEPSEGQVVNDTQTVEKPDFTSNAKLSENEAKEMQDGLQKMDPWMARKMGGGGSKE
jgi:hypothetical protein